MINTEELRRKLHSDDLIDHIDIHVGVKSTLAELLDRLEEAEKERDEVAQQLVQSEQGKRKISEERDAAEKKRDTYKAAYNEWSAKTEWVQDELAHGKLPAKYLGMHRADGIKTEIDTLRAELESWKGLAKQFGNEADELRTHLSFAKDELNRLRAEVIHWKEQKEPGAAGWRALARKLQAKVDAMEKQEPVAEWLPLDSGEDTRRD